MAVEKEKQAGTCQACFGEQRLLKGKLYVHGYKRPGIGYIHSECAGTGVEPYEVSCALVVHIRNMNIASLKSATRYLEELEAGAFSSFDIPDHNKPIRDSESRWGRTIGYETMTVHRDDPDVRKRDRYQRELADRIASARSSIGKYLAAIEFRTKMIETWEPKPIKTWKELVEDRERRGSVSGVSREAGSLIVKMARKSKASYTDDEIVEALKALGWSVQIQKALKKIDDEEVLAKMLKAEVAPFGARFWGYRGVHEPKEVWVDPSKAQALYEHLLALPFIRFLSKPSTEADEGTLFIEKLSGPMPRDHVPEETRIILQEVTLVVSKLRATAPDGASEYVEGGKWWTFAYKHGLDKDAQKYLEEHTARSGLLPNMSEDDLAELVDPPMPRGMEPKS